MRVTRQNASVGLSALILLLGYFSTLRGMFQQWMTDEDMGHGFIVPLVILWVVWRERGRWQALPVSPNWWGLALLLFGAAMQLFSALGAGLFAGSVGFLISVAGVVVCLGGFARLRAWAFPFLLSIFMLPKLAIVYNQATLPMQLMASRMAASMLTGAGLAVLRQGNILDVGGHQILVAEACNGIRYLLPLGFIAVLFGYLSDSRVWMRLVLLLAAVPIAIVANALRVAAAGAIPTLAEGTPHTVSGLVIFILCMALLVFVRRLFGAAQAGAHA